jgi:hypothetical protein
MAGYSGTPLLKKLGIKPGFKMYVANPPGEYFEWLSPLPDEVEVKIRLAKGVDFVHVFCLSQKDFHSLFTKVKSILKKEGMVWVSWPKKASRVKTDLDENIIRDFGLKSGMVDVKVCAVDETWSGLKFVFRLKDRS